MPRTLQLGRLMVAVLLAATAFSASAQFGPPRGDPNNPNPSPDPGPNPDPRPRNDPDPRPNPGPDPGPAPEPVGLGTPPWLVPGYQVVFAQYLSHQPNPTQDANQPAPKGRNSQLLFEYHVIAVTENQVVFQINVMEGAKGLPTTSDGLFDASVDGKYQGTETYYKVVDAEQVSRGLTIWMPVPTLQDLAQRPIQQPQTEDRNGVQTQATSWNQAGGQVNALSLQVLSKDWANFMIFNRDSGLRLFVRTGVGKARPGAEANDPFNREEIIFEYLAGESPINSPLLNRPFPDWTRSVKSMRYDGTHRSGAVSIPVAATLTVEQNDGHLMKGKILLQAQGEPDESKEVYMGPGSLLGYWVDPAVLAQMQEGTVHRNAVTRSNIYYRVQDTDLGRLGVFVTYNDSQSYIVVNGYSLEDGSLVYLKYELTEAKIVRELYLKNIERQ